jgi:hypothetical protein
MALKVFDLQCEHGHCFEGWFGSHGDYDAQRERGLVACPLCDSKQIIKRLSAPRLNISHPQPPQAAGAPAEAAPQPPPEAQEALAAMQAQVMRQVREWVRKAENVGAGFAAEARRIHEGEASKRPIRGTATPEERAALAQDGIDVLALPAFLDDDRLQ